MSDRAITEECGLLPLLSEGDRVMADCGFHIQDLLATRNITLNIPPFLGDRAQLSAKDVEGPVAIDSVLPPAISCLFFPTTPLASARRVIDYVISITRCP